MWTNIQSWPTCPSSPKLNWSLAHLYDPNSTPRKLAPMGQVTHTSALRLQQGNKCSFIELSSWISSERGWFTHLQPWTQKLWATPTTYSPGSYITYALGIFNVLSQLSSLKVSSLLVMLWWRRLCSPLRPSVQEWERCWFTWRTLQDTERRWDTGHF